MAHFYRDEKIRLCLFVYKWLNYGMIYQNEYDRTNDKELNDWMYSEGLAVPMEQIDGR